MENNMEAATTEQAIIECTAVVKKESFEDRLIAKEKLQKVHDIYKKHTCSALKKDSDGDTESDENSPFYVNYNTVVCSGCGAIMSSDSGFYSDAWPPKLKPGMLEDLNSFMESRARFRNPEAFVLTTRRLIQLHKRCRGKGVRHEFHTVDAMFIKYHKHFDHGYVYDTLRHKVFYERYSNGVRSLLKYEEAILGGIKEETRNDLIAWLPDRIGRSKSERKQRAEAAATLMAYAIRDKWPLDKKQISILNSRCHNSELKMQFAIELGGFSVSAINASTHRAAYKSYQYINRFLPALLNEPAKIWKLLKLEDYPTLAAQYFREHSVGVKQLSAAERDDVLLGAYKFLRDKLSPGELADLDAWARKNKALSDFQYLFGTHEEKVRAATDLRDATTNLVAVADTMEEVWPALINDDDEDKDTKEDLVKEYTRALSMKDCDRY